MRRWDGLLDRYMEEYEAAGRAVERVLAVRRELGRCGQWLKARKPKPRLEDVGADLLVRYIQSRTKFRAKATVSGVMSTLRCFGEWLVREGIWQTNPLRWMRGPKLDPFGRSPRRIETAAMQQLWLGAATSREVFYRHQWVAVLAILYGTGFRRGEIARLDVGDWDRDEGILRCDGRKTGRQRQAPVSELVACCLEAYLPQRHNHLEQHGKTDERALFVNRRGERLRKEALSRAIHRLARRQQIALCSLHQFRHTCATELLEQGVRLPEVQEILGHRSISTTVRYLHVADPQRREAINRHPLNQWL